MAGWPVVAVALALSSAERAESGKTADWFSVQPPAFPGVPGVPGDSRDVSNLDGFEEQVRELRRALELQRQRRVEANEERRWVGPARYPIVRMECDARGIVAGGVIDGACSVITIDRAGK